MPKGCKNVLVKGGKNMAGAVDVLYDGEILPPLRASSRFDTSSITQHGLHAVFCDRVQSGAGIFRPGSRRARQGICDRRDPARAGLGHGCGPLNHFCRIFPEE